MDSALVCLFQYLLVKKDTELQKLKKENELLKEKLIKFDKANDNLLQKLKEQHQRFVNQELMLDDFINKQETKYIRVNPDGSFYVTDNEELEELRNTILVQLSADNLLNGLDDINHNLQEKLFKLNRYIKKVLGENYADSEVTKIAQEVDKYLELSKFNQYKFEYVSTPEETIKVQNKNGVTVVISLKELNEELTNKLFENLKDVELKASELTSQRNDKIKEEQNILEIKVGVTVCKIDDVDSNTIYKVTAYKEDTDTYILTNNILSADVVERSRDKIYPLRFRN